MSLTAFDVSTGVFIRGLTNLKAQLRKAEDFAASSGGRESALLDARLGSAGGAPSDLHGYTLAAQVHWAAEGARLAIAQLLGAQRQPATPDTKSFAELQQRLDETLSYLRGISPTELEAGLDREIVIEHRRGSARGSGRQFLLSFAIPHFGYHVTTAYGILRNAGVPLTMGDYLANWADELR